MNKVVARFNNNKIKAWMVGKEIHVIEAKSIKENLKIHREFEYDIKSVTNQFENEDVIERNIIVKETKNGYSLLFGVKWFRIAKELGKSINCVVLGKDANRQNLVKEIGIIEGDLAIPKGTDSIFLIDKINIPKGFLLKTPRAEKINENREYFNKNNTVSKPITIDSKTKTLIDGYARYLILKENNVKYIPVCYKGKVNMKIRENTNGKQ